MPTNNPTPNTNPASGTINVDEIMHSLESMNQMLGNIVDVFEKNGRQNSPASIYSQYSLERSRRRRRPDGRKYSEKAWKDLTKDEISNFLSANSGNYKADIDKQKKIIKDNKAILNNRNASVTEKRTAKEKIKFAQKEKKEIQKKQLEEGHDAWEDNREYSDKSIEERWTNMSKEERSNYGNDKQRYFKAEKFEEAYEAKSAAVSRASNMIANSGIGHTKVGRGLQSALSKVQTFRDIQRFGMKMQNGGAKKLATRLVGKGGAGKAVTRVLSILGKGAAAAAGPLMIVAGIVAAVIIAFKMWGEAVAAVARYKGAEANIETDLLNAEYDYYEQTLQANADYQSQLIQTQGQIKLKELDNVGQNLLEASKIIAEQYAKSHEIAANYAFKGINKSAYEAANAAMETAADIRKFEVHKEQRSKELSATKAAAGAQMGAAGAQMTAAKTMAKKTYENRYAQGQMEYNLLDAKQYMVANSGDKAKSLLTSEALARAEGGNKHIVGSHNLGRGVIQTEGYEHYNNRMNFTEALALDKAETLENLQKAQRSLFRRDSEIILGKASLDSKRLANAARVTATAAGINANLAQKAASIASQKQEIIIDAALQIKKTWLAFAEKVEEYVGEFDKHANDLGINLGFTSSSELTQYKKSMFPIIRDKVSKWGKGIEDAKKGQEEYIQNTGRNKIFSGEDYYTLMAANLLTGDDNTAVEILSNSEIFNGDMQGTLRRTMQWANKVNRSGLNARKYMKDVAKNLKLVEKYNFVDGTEGLMRMQKWAQQTRFNMDSLGNMIDKVRNGTYEEAIIESGQLQVLGGFAAINSDPFGLIYDAWGDAEAFAKRIHGMIKRFGKINPKSGETTYTDSERMMIAAIAKAVGENTENLIAQAMAENKSNTIRDYIKDNNIADGWTKELLENVINRASYNESTGKWQVSVKTKNEKGETQFINKDIDQLNPENEDDFLMPDTFEDQMENHLQSIISALDSMTGEEIAEKTDIANATYAKVMEEWKKRTEIAMKQYNDNRDEYIKQATAGMKDATDAWEGYIGQWKAGNEQVDAEVSKLTAIATNLNTQLGILQTVIDTGTTNLGGVAAAVVDSNKIVGTDYTAEEIKNKSAAAFEKTLNKQNGHGSAKQNTMKFGEKGNTFEANMEAYKSSNMVNRSFRRTLTESGLNYETAGPRVRQLIEEGARIGYQNYERALEREAEKNKNSLANDITYPSELAYKDALISPNFRPMTQNLSSPFSTLFGEILPSIKQMSNTLDMLPDEYLDENEVEIDNILSGQNTPTNLTASFGGKMKFNINKTNGGSIEDLFNDSLQMRNLAGSTTKQYLITANGGRAQTYWQRGYTNVR